MNSQSGYTELTINGELLPFKFGTNAYALYCEMHGIDLWELSKTGIFGEVDGETVVKAPSLLRLRELFFCAYRAACAIEGKPVKFNIFQVTEAIEADAEAMTKLREAMLKGTIIGVSVGNPPEPVV